MKPGSGILLIDKPAGVTSFAVVNHIRKSLVSAYPTLSPPRKRGKGGNRPPKFKCGHAGTLDPLATGLLLVMVGRGSRISQFLLGLSKTYHATIRFGIATDTLDREGAITAQEPVTIAPEAISAVLPQFMGDINQIPPIISALKVDGKALYKRARSGEEVAEPEARPVTISKLVLQNIRWGVKADDGLINEDKPVFEIDLLVECGSGTYIRSLARDIALAAGSLGHIHELRRIDVGPFEVQDALSNIMTLDGLAIANAIQPLAESLPHVPLLTLSSEEVGIIRQGQQPQVGWLTRLDRQPEFVGKAGYLFRMLDEDLALVAVGVLDEENGKPKTAMVIPEDPSTSIDHRRVPTCD